MSALSIQKSGSQINCVYDNQGKFFKFILKRGIAGHLTNLVPYKIN